MLLGTVRPLSVGGSGGGTEMVEEQQVGKARKPAAQWLRGHRWTAERRPQPEARETAEARGPTEVRVPPPEATKTTTTATSGGVVEVAAVWTEQACPIGIEACVAGARDGEFTLATTAGKAQEDDAGRKSAAPRQAFAAPLFIVSECAVVLLLWLALAWMRHVHEGVDMLTAEAGLDTIWRGQTDLRIAGPECQDYRLQVWRWLTYQFTHIGLLHVLTNILLLLVLGVPLEASQGHWRTAVIFNGGVLGGAMSYFVGAAHAPTVGCSGGCYALIGAHLADLAMNWDRRKCLALAVLCTLMAADLASYFVTVFSVKASHSAHVGGSVAGLLFGIAVCTQERPTRCRRLCSAFALVLGILLALLCLAWLATQDGAGPRNLSEALAGEPGWCWVRQVYSWSFTSGRYECVRCGSTACVDRWSRSDSVELVDPDVCSQVGFLYDER